MTLEDARSRQTGQIGTFVLQTGQIGSSGGLNRAANVRICPVCEKCVRICPVCGAWRHGERADRHGARTGRHTARMASPDPAAPRDASRSLWRASLEYINIILSEAKDPSSFRIDSFVGEVRGPSLRNVLVTLSVSFHVFPMRTIHHLPTFSSLHDRF